MPAMHSAWIYYLNNPAWVVNALALFYALSGSWLVLATQYRNRRPLLPATSPAHAGCSPTKHGANRLFYRIAAVCLALGLLLSLISTRLPT